MIRKIIPLILLLTCLVLSQITHLSIYKEIIKFIPYTSGWALLISIGYLLMAVKHKEGIICILSCWGLIITTLFEITIKVISPTPDREHSYLIQYFDIGFIGIVLLILITFIFFKSTREKLF